MHYNTYVTQSPAIEGKQPDRQAMLPFGSCISVSTRCEYIILVVQRGNIMVMLVGRILQPPVFEKLSYLRQIALRDLRQRAASARNNI